MFILDTSAIRGISHPKLTEAKSKVGIAVSTQTVLELASHLDDPEYLRARGNFLKCQIPLLLNDPFWLLSDKLHLSANSTRGEDKLVLSQLLLAVQQSQSLADLGTKTLTYPDGTIASCIDAGKIIEEILQKEEVTYIAHIKSLPALAGLDPLLNGKHTLTSEALFGYLADAAKSLSPTNDRSLQAKTFLATAPYFGYLMHRLYQYANRRPRGETELCIDANDCEDAYIALILDLNTFDTLVTNDYGTLDALKNTTIRLNEILPIPLNSSLVMSNDEFLRFIES
ncbi:hypothetical protein [Acidithiobacillus ferrivorans]|nr:hypothetical protein [Acidithiobacillus ferrivorans]